MTWDGRKAGVPLPAGFHNWPVEHELDGTHKDSVFGPGGEWNDHVIKNGSFEHFTGDVPDHWTHAGGTHTWSQSDTVAKEGTYSFKQVGPGVQSDDYHEQSFDTVPGEDYYAEVFVACQVAPTAGYFYFAAQPTTDVTIARLDQVTTDWVKMCFYFTADDSTVWLFIGGSVQGGTVYWDACDVKRIRAKGY